MNWGVLFDEKRGLTITGHSPSMGSVRPYGEVTYGFTFSYGRPNREHPLTYEISCLLLSICSSVTLVKAMIEGEKKNAYNGLVGEPKGKRAIGRSVRIWENNIKMDLKKEG
jgi:hypothetical protein